MLYVFFWVIQTPGNYPEESIQHQYDCFNTFSRYRSLFPPCRNGVQRINSAHQLLFPFTPYPNYLPYHSTCITLISGGDREVVKFCFGLPLIFLFGREPLVRVCDLASWVKRTVCVCVLVIFPTMLGRYSGTFRCVKWA
jgi:hypothetical protein